jgi:cytochrome oxidase Cu insertion factor (SCO1/SenC/PrrC family)
MTSTSSNSPQLSKPLGRVKLMLILAVCAAPVIGSYLTYYFIKPETRSNYGTLVQPQRPLPALVLSELDGRTVEAAALKGKWLLISVDDGACAQACSDKLYHMRQVRLTTGKNRDRVERLWLVADREPLPTMLIREYDGMRMLRADPAQLAAWLPADEGTTISDHIFVVDPQGNLMMRFPKNADPNQTKKDLSKLLRASAIG